MIRGMHELSLACSVVELVEKELALHGGGSVRCIEITIGDLSGVDNDAFLFSLNMVLELTLIHISEHTRISHSSRNPSAA